MNETADFIVHLRARDRAGNLEAPMLRPWQIGGYQAGKTFLVDHQELLDQLEVLRDGETFSYEQRRRRRLVAELESVRKYLRAAAVKIPLRPQARYQIATLPPDVDLQPGRLRVEDLLSKLFELAQSAAKAFHQLRVLRVSAIERSRPH